MEVKNAVSWAYKIDRQERLEQIKDWITKVKTQSHKDKSGYKSLVLLMDVIDTTRKPKLKTERCRYETWLFEFSFTAGSSHTISYILARHTNSR